MNCLICNLEMKEDDNGDYIFCQTNDHYCNLYEDIIYIYFKLESFEMTEFYFNNSNNPENLNNFNFEIIKIIPNVITKYVKIYSDDNVKINNNDFKSVATRIYNNLLFI